MWVEWLAVYQWQGKLRHITQGDSEVAPRDPGLQVEMGAITQVDLICVRVFELEAGLQPQILLTRKTYPVISS